MTLAFALEDAEGLVWKIALLEGKLAQENQAWELAEANSHGLFDMAADVEHREQFEELTLLQTQGSKLCHAIVDPPRVRNHLLVGM
jgi:hypothetical protein